MRIVTKTAIREARLKEIKQEMLASNKLKVREIIHLYVAVSQMLYELTFWFFFLVFTDSVQLRNKALIIVFVAE